MIPQRNKKVVEVHNSSVRKQEIPIQLAILTHGAVISHRTKAGDFQTSTQASRNPLLDTFLKLQLRHLNKRQKLNKTLEFGTERGICDSFLPIISVSSQLYGRCRYPDTFAGNWEKDIIVITELTFKI